MWADCVSPAGDQVQQLTVHFRFSLPEMLFTLGGTSDMISGVHQEVGVGIFCLDLPLCIGG